MSSKSQSWRCVSVKEDKLRGIITEKDIINNLQKMNLPIKKFISKKIISISPEDSIEKALELMAQYKVKRLPVIADGNLKGVIKITDIAGHTNSIEEGEFLFN